MLRAFYPHEYVESVFAIDYRKLYDIGYRAILFDLDNTLTHHGEGSTKRVDELFQRIHAIGLKTIILSDNSEERIKRFLKNIDSLYIHEANKPSVAGYVRAVEMLRVTKKEALMIGDQVFRDIYGANKTGMDSILVQYMRHENETKIGVRRHLEKIVLMFYRRSKRFRNRIGDIHVDEG